jgi:hypothetical protein
MIELKKQIVTGFLAGLMLFKSAITLDLRCQGGANSETPATCQSMFVNPENQI